MNTVEFLLAAFALALCVLLLARLALGERRRQRVDAALAGAWRGVRLRLSGLTGKRGAQRDANRLAQEAIARAKRRAAHDQDGNVVRPEAFKRPRKPH